MISVDTENPHKHWEFVNVTNRTVIDLGCGRWEKVEYRDPSWPTTPEYFILKGANKVIAVDSDPEEIKWFLTNINGPEFAYMFDYISSPDSFKKLIDFIKPDCIKCDIEGGEIHLINLDDEYFKQVTEYYIETHSDILYNMTIAKLIKCDYDVIETIDLVHTHGACKVIFAKKKL